MIKSGLFKISLEVMATVLIIYPKQCCTCTEWKQSHTRLNSLSVHRQLMAHLGCLVAVSGGVQVKTECAAVHYSAKASIN